MAYFNNLIVGGTAKFLQDVKIAGLESTPEELNALHAEEGDVDGIIFTPDTPYDEVIEDEFYNVKNKSFGLIKDNYYTFKYKRNGKIINSETVQAVELPADSIGVSGVISLDSDWNFYDNVNIDSTGTPTAGGHMWSSFPEDVDEIIIEGVITSGKLTHPGMVYNTIPLEHIPQITTDKLPKSIEDVFDPGIEENEEFHSPYNYYEEGLKFYLSPANGDYRIYKRKIGLKVGNTYNYEIHTITGELTYPTTSTGTCVCQLIDLWGAEYPALFINEGDDSPAVIDGVNYNNDTSDFYKDDTYCISCKYTSDTSASASIKLTGEDIDGNPLTTKELYIRPVIETDIIGSASTLHGLTLTVEEINKIPVNSVGRKGTGDSAETFNNSNYASGDYSHAEGNSTHATGNYSHSEGYKTRASGNNSHAEGNESVASGVDSHAEGYRTTAKGQCSHAEGYSSNQATGTTEDEIRSAWESKKFSCAFGGYSHVEGFNNLALGDRSHAEGLWTIAKSDSAHAEGYYSTANGKGAHSEGVGTNVVPESLLSDDTTIEDIESSWKTTKFNYAKGKAAHTEGLNCIALNIGTHAEGCYTKSTGEHAHAEGYSTTASGEYSHAEGSYTTASGNNSHAEGYDTEASEAQSHAEGTRTTASGGSSHAEGASTHALGIAAHAEGDSTWAHGNASSSHGYYTVASTGYAQAVFGKHNTEITAPNFSNIQDPENADALFIIGCGTSSATKNAFRVTSGGKCYGADAFGASGADFAELFEWADGNPDNEDRRGLFVTLDGEKIKLANADDDYIGIISDDQAFIGNSASEEWQGKYLTDIFGGKLTQEVEVPEVVDEITGEVIQEATTAIQYVLNPDYNPDEEYIMRENRKEWGIVGLVGQIVLIDDGSCVVGGRVVPKENGIGTASTTKEGYRVMARLDETHIKVLVK